MKKLDLRILQIDLGRQKETVAYIKSYIDFAKENGYTSLLMYLEAAVKVDCVPFFSSDDTYTPGEIREIVAYGNRQGIDIIPALEDLAHVENFLRYEQLAFLSECKDAMVDGRGIVSGLGHCACPSNPEGMAFLDTYYRQVMELFTSQYVHVGMDEPFDFAVCPRCAQRIQNGETKDDIFYTHLMRVYDLVKSFGRTMMMWDDFFEYLDVVERLSRDIILCNWNYGFVGDEPQGHWINRKKKDWFRYYDRLGFRYLFCTYANSASKLNNIDTFTAYASKYHPAGALMTVWERSAKFYLCSYPAIAYTGRFWSGKATDEDKLKIYTEFLGSEEAADIVLNLEAIGGSTYPNNTKICENTTAATDSATRLLGYTLPRLRRIADEMEDCLAKDILQDIYSYELSTYLAREKHRICLEIFDNYETRSKTPAYFAKKFLPLRELNRYAHQNALRLWAKYRPGIKPSGGKFGDAAIAFGHYGQRILKGYLVAVCIDAGGGIVAHAGSAHQRGDFGFALQTVYFGIEAVLDEVCADHVCDDRNAGFFGLHLKSGGQGAHLAVGLISAHDLHAVVAKLFGLGYNIKDIHAPVAHGLRKTVGTDCNFHYEEIPPYVPWIRSGFLCSRDT